jgi:beta-phosphoglucomutase-like phosphatase (HAD superfamily)
LTGARGAIFDMDGVLVDSGVHHRAAWRALLDELGETPAQHDYWRLTIGRPGTEAVPLLLGRIQRMLKESEELGLLSISILQNERMEQALGARGYESLVRDIASFLVEVKKATLRREDYLAEVMIRPLRLKAKGEPSGLPGADNVPAASGPTAGSRARR